MNEGQHIIFPGQLHEQDSIGTSRFDAPLRGAKTRFDRVPRVPLRSTLGYFRVFPTGRTQMALDFSGRRSSLEQQETFMRWP